jgi:hypothetical protein
MYWQSALPVVGVLIRASSKGYKDLHKDMTASIAYCTKCLKPVGFRWNRLAA